MPEATNLLGIGLMMLSISGPITAAIIKAKWGAGKPTSSPPANGSKVDVREFADFREEVRETFRTIKGQFDTIHTLIVNRL